MRKGSGGRSSAVVSQPLKKIASRKTVVEEPATKKLTKEQRAVIKAAEATGLTKEDARAFERQIRRFCRGGQPYSQIAFDELGKLTLSEADFDVTSLELKSDDRFDSPAYDFLRKKF